MALIKTMNSLIELKLKFARDSAFKQVVFDELFDDLSTTAKEIDIQNYVQAGLTTDKSLLAAEIPNPKVIFVMFRSVDTVLSDQPATIPVKLNGSTEFQIDHIFMRKADVLTDYLDVSTFTFSQTADQETEVLVITFGDN